MRWPLARATRGTTVGNTAVACVGADCRRVRRTGLPDPSVQPRYQVVGSEGPDHDKTFEIALLVGEREFSRGQGKSKKEAEQRAAERALTVLDEETPQPIKGP